MSKSTTLSKPDKPMPPEFDDGGMDWAAFEAMTDADIAAAALTDPDTRPVDKSLGPNARRVGLHGVIRLRLRLTHDEFATRYHVPADTLHDWERGRATPDPIAAAYLVLIDADPDGVAETLARQQQAAAAE